MRISIVCFAVLLSWTGLAFVCLRVWTPFWKTRPGWLAKIGFDTTRHDRARVQVQAGLGYCMSNVGVLGYDMYMISCPVLHDWFN